MGAVGGDVHGGTTAAQLTGRAVVRQTLAGPLQPGVPYAVRAWVKS